MTDKEYEQKKKECWEEFMVLNGTILETTKQAYDWIWNRAYALGKQEKDSEGEEMLTVSRKRVQEIFVDAQKSAPSCEYDRGFRGAELTILRNLFGSKCLPSEVKPTESGRFEPQLPGDNLSPKTKAAEPKKEDSSLLKAESVENLRIADEESHYLNLPQEISNCDKCPKMSKKTHPNFGHSRLRIAALAMQGIISNKHVLRIVIESGQATLEDDHCLSFRAVAKASFAFADALLKESEKGESDGKD